MEIKQQKRSPIKDRPLRNPGQSLDEQREELAYDRVLTPALIAVFVVMLAGLEWAKSIFSIPPSPRFYTIVSLLFVVYAGYSVYRVWPILRALRQGSDGEKAVGQYLERLREQGYSVFHDLVGKGFNIDHVLIGPAGVFTIETKTYSKAPGPDVRVRFDGETLTVDGVELDKDPIVQGKAQAGWLRLVLEESTGRKLLTRSVILFPGWFVEQKPGTSREVWVLEPKALPGFLKHEPELLSPEDVKLATFHLSRFIRTQAD